MIITEEPSLWRARLRPASFRGIVFHVDVGGIASGRRVALHEFPKRNVPFGEDMGRKARRWPITGYVIVSPQETDYIPHRDALIAALEADGPGLLVHPTLGENLVMAEPFSAHEERTKGGYCQFDMNFVERGSPVMYDVVSNTASQTLGAATTLSTAAADFLDRNIGTQPTMSSDAPADFGNT